MENEYYNHISDFNPNNFFISCDPANIALSQSVKILAHSTYGTMMFNEPVEDYQLGYLDDWMRQMDDVLFDRSSPEGKIRKNYLRWEMECLKWKKIK